MTLQGELLLERRPPAGIWGGLLSLPEVDAIDVLPQWCEQLFGTRILEQQTWPSLRHTFSHYHLDIVPVMLRSDIPKDRVMESGRWVWYKDGPLQGGLPAPVKKLVAQLFEQTGRTDDTNGAVRKTG
jgi:A/G-specific adenine glycosylase